MCACASVAEPTCGSDFLCGHMGKHAADAAGLCRGRSRAPVVLPFLRCFFVLGGGARRGGLALTHAHLDGQLLLAGRFHQLATHLHHPLFLLAGQHRLPQTPRRGRPMGRETPAGQFAVPAAGSKCKHKRTTRP